MVTDSNFSPDEVGRWLDQLYIASAGATLRAEDKRKAIEVAALLSEIDRALRGLSKARGLTVVDAASGKAYVGLLTAKLVLEAIARPAKVVCIERNPALVARTEMAAQTLASTVPITCECADLSQAGVWPNAPALVVALHACGPASDVIIEQAVASATRVLLLVPCCVGAGVAKVKDAEALAEALGVPRTAPVRRRFVHAIIEADRVLTLEAAGYQTEAVEFVAPTVTPYNTLLRARRVGEPHRVAQAHKARLRLWSHSSHVVTPS
ncbi:MAG: methyltransferase [Deltaproteobacteria bacterium]|nr:methyltransferase [Deltaproteobacteria bacterium]